MSAHSYRLDCVVPAHSGLDLCFTRHISRTEKDKRPMTDTTLLVEVTTLGGYPVRHGVSEFPSKNEYRDAVELLLSTNDEVILVDRDSDLQLRYYHARTWHTPECAWTRSGGRRNPLTGEGGAKCDCGFDVTPEPEVVTWRHNDGTVRVDHMDAAPGDYYGPPPLIP